MDDEIIELLKGSHVFIPRRRVQFFGVCNPPCSVGLWIERRNLENDFAEMFPDLLRYPLPSFEFVIQNGLDFLTGEHEVTKDTINI